MRGDSDTDALYSRISNSFYKSVESKAGRSQVLLFICSVSMQYGGEFNFVTYDVEEGSIFTYP